MSKKTDGAIYVSNSNNTKISGDKKIDATYASIKSTCPNSCALKKAGCYALTSHVGIVVSRLDKKAKQSEPLQVARAEARAIDQSYKSGLVPTGRDLRLHVSGDSRTVKGTRVLNSAVKRWKKRGGNIAYSYTHAWRNVHRSEWSQVSVLASVDSIKQVRGARKQGYAPAIVVGEHVSDKAYKLKGNSTVFIPCPQQTKGVPCIKCRLCFNADRLYEDNMGIAFAAHGVYKNVIKRRLSVIQ